EAGRALWNQIDVVQSTQRDIADIGEGGRIAAGSDRPVVDGRESGSRAEPAERGSGAESGVGALLIATDRPFRFVQRGSGKPQSRIDQVPADSTTIPNAYRTGQVMLDQHNPHRDF